MPGKYSQASTGASPSAVQLNPPGGISGKRGPREYPPPPHTWAYTRTFKERGIEEIRASTEIVKFLQ
jgi:hypothetical protein